MLKALKEVGWGVLMLGLSATVFFLASIFFASGGGLLLGLICTASGLLGTFTAAACFYKAYQEIKNSLAKTDNVMSNVTMPLDSPTSTKSSVGSSLYLHKQGMLVDPSASTKSTLPQGMLVDPSASAKSTLPLNRDVISTKKSFWDTWINRQPDNLVTNDKVSHKNRL